MNNVSYEMQTTPNPLARLYRKSVNGLPMSYSVPQPRPLAPSCTATAELINCPSVRSALIFPNYWSVVVYAITDWLVVERLVVRALSEFDSNEQYSVDDKPTHWAYDYVANWAAKNAHPHGGDLQCEYASDSYVFIRLIGSCLGCPFIDGLRAQISTVFKEKGIQIFWL